MEEQNFHLFANDRIGRLWGAYVCVDRLTESK